MKSTIGIIELYQHSEVLIHYCKLLLNGDHHIKVFCPKEMHQDLPIDIKENKKFSWYLNTADIGTFINNHEDHFSSCDFVLVTTIFSHFKDFLKIPASTKCALIIHSLHTWVEPYKHIKLRKQFFLKDLVRLIRFFIQGQSRSRKKVLNAFNYVGLGNDSILSYAQRNVQSQLTNKFRSTPFGGYLGRSRPPKRDKFRFTITGTLEDNVRDYYLVLNAIKKNEHKFTVPTQLLLLGKPKGDSGIQIKKAFESLDVPNLEIVTFDTYISEQSYEANLKSTDVLIVPVKSTVHYIAFEELAFQSKLSGSVNDLLRYGIPSLVSSCFSVDEKIDARLTYFNSAEELGKSMINCLSKRNELTDNKYVSYAYPELYKNLKRNLNF